MPVTAQSVVRRATDILQDQTSVRWTADELVRWLNDGQREIALYRPDAVATYGAVTLVAGSRQSLPASGFKLLDIPNNAAGTKAAIRQVDRRTLDELNPAWHSMTGTSTVVHYCYDQRDPRTFYVYPPSLGGNAVNAVYAAYPTDIAEPSPGSTYTSVTGNISVPDIYAGALLDYVLHRGYTKNSEYAGDPARAVAHYTAFTNALGVEAKSTDAVAPTAGAPGKMAGGAV